MPSAIQSGYELPTYAFMKPRELDAAALTDQKKYPVIVVGAGLAGLTAACDLAIKGVEVLLIDDDDTVGVRGAASRGICYAQKSLEIFERLGTFSRIAEKGIQWSIGKTLAGDEVVYSFDLSQQNSHNASTQPPFINLQQFYIEWYLVDRLLQLPNVEIRWKSTIVDVSQNDDQVDIEINCPDGRYSLRTDWLIDATGIRSPIRDRFGLKTNPALGEDRWCISDVRFKHQPPIERWTWVEAPFNENRAVWQHLMGDDVWRLDYQMAPDADPEVISRPEVVADRLRAQFGPDVDFELVWVGPYGYRSHVLEQLKLGRVFFLGDSAHVMSPFGARGGNSAIQDADNLSWKLALVIAGALDSSVLDSYHTERHLAAEQNVSITNRTMRFLTPQTPMQKVFRRAVLDLARTFEFAQPLINTGRLSTPTEYVAQDGYGLHWGINIANCLMHEASGEVTNLVQLVHKEQGKLIFLCVDQASFEAVQKRWSGHSAFAIKLLDPQVLRVASDDEVSLHQWADSTGYLRKRFSLEPGSVGVLRPDLHSAGTYNLVELDVYIATFWPQPLQYTSTRAH